jgi:phosphoribosylamine--glycine ligase
VKILIVGGGGREHALAWRLAQSPGVEALVASPGNPGIAQVASCIAAPAEISGYADLAKAHSIDLTVVGPEAPLVAGIVDQFERRGLRIIGPTQAAARLEGSKIFAKRLFERGRVPTARSEQVTGYNEALSVIKFFSFPVVIKADGLAAGKGVVIAHDRAQARDAIQRLGPNLVIEEFLEGEEVSFIGLSDGRELFPLAPAQDHKRVFDGDEGPNTGGMGAYTDPRILTAAQSSDIMERIMLPTLRQMRVQGAPFAGFLFAGLMLTADGPKVLEFNARLGDPETQAILHSFRGDFAAFLDHPGDAKPGWSGCSVCITLASAGYPNTPRLDDAITGIAEAESTGATVFQAGTKEQNGNLVTAGGRVLGVTAGADSLPDAVERAYRAAGHISFAGMHYRKDIGQKGLGRW